MTFANLSRQDRDRVLAWLRHREWRVVNRGSIRMEAPGILLQNDKFCLGALLNVEHAVLLQVAHERVLEHPSPEPLASGR